MSAMVWLGALMALAACGGGESLTFDESMDLLSSALDTTFADRFSYDSITVEMVERDGSLREYTQDTYNIYYDRNRGQFGYAEINNPFAPLDRRHFLTVDSVNYEFIESRQCYSDNPTFIVFWDPDPDYYQLMMPNMEMAKYTGGRRVLENGSVKEVIEFERRPGSTDTYTVEDGALVETVVYIEGDVYGRRVGDGFDGKIVAKKYIRRYYDIGEKKDFPVPEPICE